MDKGDWKEFCAVVQAADEVTAGKPRSERALRLMFVVLERYGIDEIRRAVSGHVRRNKFAVTPADIVQALSGSLEERSAVAWRTFVNALDRHGYYDSVRFPDPAYHYAVMQLGGWERVSRDFGELSEKELHFRAAEWRKLYEIGMRVAAWRETPGKTAVPERLTGFYERDNRERGYLADIPAPIQIQPGLAQPRAVGEGQGRGALPHTPPGDFSPLDPRSANRFSHSENRFAAHGVQGTEFPAGGAGAEPPRPCPSPKEGA